MVAGDLLFDWIYAVVTELRPAEVSFKRDWEKKSSWKRITGKSSFSQVMWTREAHSLGGKTLHIRLVPNANRTLSIHTDSTSVVTWVKTVKQVEPRKSTLEG
jgi:hypothetical protein